MVNAHPHSLRAWVSDLRHLVQVSEVHSDLGQLRCWNLRWKVGGFEALPVIQPSGSDVEISVDPSTQCGFMVDWGLFVLAARWSAAFPFLFASPASVTAAFRLVVLPSLLSRGVTLDISLIVFRHVSVIGSLACGVCKTLRVLVTPCWSHQQLRRCTWRVT